MPPLFWIDTTIFFFSMIVSASLTFLVFVIDPRNKVNIFFSLFTLSAAVWSGGALLMRLSLWTGFGNPDFLGEIATMGFLYLGVLLLLFSNHFLNRRSRFIDIIVIAGLSISILVAFPLFRHEVVYGHFINEAGTTHNHFTTLGLILSLIPVSFITWAFILFLDRKSVV